LLLKKSNSCGNLEAGFFCKRRKNKAWLIRALNIKACNSTIGGNVSLVFGFAIYSCSAEVLNREMTDR